MQTKFKKLTFIPITILVILCVVFIGKMAYATDETQMVTATINYYYYDADTIDHKGKIPYPAFVAHMPKNSSSITETSPTVAGYVAKNLDGTSMDKVTVSFKEDSTVDVFYYPDKVAYSIQVYLQNINDDDYSADTIINNTGYTGDVPDEFTSGTTTMDRKGFTLMYHVPDTIAADGSTVFECYYDRNYYSIEVDLGTGGYGVESTYAKYGSNINLETPTRTGYTFLGWDVVNADNNTSLDKVPDTVPAYNIKVTAQWAVETVNYRVVYMNADIKSDDSSETTYSYWGSAKRTAQADSTISLSDVISANATNITDEVKESLTDYKYFTFDETTTREKNNETITISADGTTVIRLYYSRNKYTLRFVYARKSVTEITTKVYDSNTTLTPATNITSEHEYIIVNNYTNMVLTTNTNTSTVVNGWGKTTYTRLALTTLNYNTNPVWTITGGDGKFTIKNNGNYLTLRSNTATTIKSSTTLNLTLTSNTDGTWSISQTISNRGSNTTYYLTYLTDNNLTGAGSSTTSSSNSSWILYDISDLTYTTNTEENLGSVELAGSTGNGNYNDGKEIWWTKWTSKYPVSGLPTINDNKGGKLESGSYLDNKGAYRLYYVQLTAEYNANIEDIWPSNIFEPLTSTNNKCVYTFGSWASEYGSPYRKKYQNTGHENIIGKYPTMSAELINDSAPLIEDVEDNTYLAQTLYAWWGVNITGGTNDDVSAHRYYIYYEALDDADTTQSDLVFNESTYSFNRVVTYDGTTYIFDRRLDFTSSHNSDTRTDPFTYVGYTVTYKSNEKIQKDTDSGGVTYTTFYYTRNVHTLKYYNNGVSLDNCEKTIKYGTKLTENSYDITPTYPNNLPAGKYEFKGWYTIDIYEDQYKVNWENFTMPDSDVTLYAYWAPKTYTVNFYNDETQLNGTLLDTQTVAYGNFADDSNITTNPPTYTSGTTTITAKQVGWFYYDSSGTLHAFDPKTTTVTDNLDLFIKWTSNVPTYYQVDYVYTDSNGEKVNVAPSTTGYSFVGLTRTFKAKTNNDLSEGYREHYFPTIESTSILMSNDGNQNTATFNYIYKESVQYTVKYIDEATGASLLTDKITNSTNAIVTEKYVPVSGYVPTSYYQSLVLTASNDDTADTQHNVIIFYYKADTTNMYVHVKYLLEDDNGTFSYIGSDNPTALSGLKFTEQAYIDETDTVGLDKSFEVTSYTGYTVQGYTVTDTYKSGTTQTSSLNTLDNSYKNLTINLNQGTNTENPIDSKEIYIYYTKNIYSVTVQYKINSDAPQRVAEWDTALNKSTNITLTPVTDGESTLSTVTYDGKTYYTLYSYTADGNKYNSTYVATAPELDGFRLVGNNDSKSVIVKDSSAVITFEYTAVGNIMFYFKAVFPEEAINTDSYKALSRSQMNVAINTRPENSVTAQSVIGNYKFIGWYTDPECINPVTNTTTDDIITGEGGNIIQPLASNVDVTYYAKYDYKRGDLTITNTFKSDNDKDTSQAFEYIITGTDDHNNWVNLKVCIVGNGSETIKDLPIGNYTITQTGWSWRYNGESESTKPANVLTTETVEVTFTQVMLNTQWLDGNGYLDNNFTSTSK